MIILGKDGKEYSTVKECMAADAEFDKKLAEEKAAAEAKMVAEEEKLARRKSEISKRKKELSTRIERAQDAVSQARKDYDTAREQAEAILVEARKQASELLSAADAKLKDATKEEVAAIREFNKEFGTYTTVLTGDAAWNEYKRVSNNFEDMFSVFKHLMRF